MQHLKKSGLSPEDSDRESVETMLRDIKQNGEQTVRALAKNFMGGKVISFLVRKRSSA
jgi:hypothetical protein